MDTTQRSYYTINASLLKVQDIHHPAINNIRFNILVNEPGDLAPRLFTVVNALKSGFMVSLSADLLRDPNFDSEVLPGLYVLYTLNKYPHRQHIMPVFTDDKDLDLSRVGIYLSEQGITDAEFPLFSLTGPGRQTSGSCSLLLLTDTQATDTDIVNPFPGHEGYSIIAQNGVDERDSERELWKKRAHVYRDFLTLSKKVQQKEYYDVLNWYKKEYEVLPLWYKRFGHIIKVLMGKRKFRSLFNDKVKKHNA